jgi:hypothetical protein
VTLVLPSDLPRLPIGAKLEVRLALRETEPIVTSDVVQSSRESAPTLVSGVFDSSGEVEVGIELDGNYGVAFVLRFESRFQQLVSNISGPSEPVYVSADAGRIVVAPERDEYIDVVRRLR